MYFNVTISSATVALETIKHAKDIQAFKDLNVALESLPEYNL